MRGKTLRRSFDKASGTSPLHMVSADSSAARMVLGQHGVPGKSNEIPAVRALIALLDLDGAVVTADAMHCQKETAQAICDKGADYVLASKGNRSGIEADVALFLADPATRQDDVATTTDADHGRIAERRAAVYAAPWLAEAHGFPGVAAVGVVESSRETGAGTTTARRLFLFSKAMSAAQFALVRAHWSIENSLHRVLDVTFDEDRTRPSTRSGPQGHRPAKPRRPAPPRPRPATKKHAPTLGPAQDRARRLARRLPRRNPHSNAIALADGP